MDIIIRAPPAGRGDGMFPQNEMAVHPCDALPARAVEARWRLGVHEAPANPAGVGDRTEGTGTNLSALPRRLNVLPAIQSWKRLD
jgi:hypothetical protein